MKTQGRTASERQNSLNLGGSVSPAARKRSRSRARIRARDLEETGEAAADIRPPGAGAAAFQPRSEICVTFGLACGGAAASGARFSRGLIIPGNLPAMPSITYLFLLLFQTENQQRFTCRHLLTASNYVNTNLTRLISACIYFGSFSVHRTSM